MTNNDYLRRKRIKIAEATFIVIVLLLAFGMYLVLQTGQSDSKTSLVAAISRDGSVVKTIDLNSVDKPYELTFEDERGINIIEVEQGRIRVSDADCLNQVCVNIGWIDKPGVPIACVPHGLTITIQERESAYGPDAVSH